MGRRKFTLREKLNRQLSRLQADMEIIKTQLGGILEGDKPDETKKEEGNEYHN
jgi:hypothetical protein